MKLPIYTRIFYGAFYILVMPQWSGNQRRPGRCLYLRGDPPAAAVARRQRRCIQIAMTKRKAAGCLTKPTSYIGTNTKRHTHTHTSFCRPRVLRAVIHMWCSLLILANIGAEQPLSLSLLLSLSFFIYITIYIYIRKAADFFYQSGWD